MKKNIQLYKIVFANGKSRNLHIIDSLLRVYKNRRDIVSVTPTEVKETVKVPSMIHANFCS